MTHNYKQSDTYLSEILSNVISKYGHDSDYHIPTISWAKECMQGALGMYQYWNNHIVISKMLQITEINDKHMEAIVFHELNHQTYENDDEVHKVTKNFMKDIEEVLKEADKLTCNHSFEGEPNENNLVFDTNKDIILVRVPYDSHGPDDILNSWLYQNHCFLIDVAENSVETHNKSDCQVVLVLESDGILYAYCWIRDAALLCETKTADFSFCSVKYNIVAKHSDTRVLFPPQPQMIIPARDLHDDLCLNQPYTVKDVNTKGKIARVIKDYMFDYYTLGIDDAALNNQSWLTTTNHTEILERVRKRGASFRNIWDMNLAVKIHPSKDSLTERAIVFNQIGITDLAIRDFKRAEEYNDRYTGELTKEQIDKLKKDAEYDQMIMEMIVDF